MNRILIISVVVLISTNSCIKEIFCIDGNGKVGTEIRSAVDFHEAVNTTEVDLIYHKSDTLSISVRAETNLIPHILTSISNGKLEVRTSPRNACFDYTQKPVVIITSPGLSIVELTGSGNFSADALTAHSVNIKSTGSGDITAANISCTDLTITLTGSGDTDVDNVSGESADFTVTGSGDLSIKGNGNSGTMRVTGSGNIEAGEFTLNSAVETITGSGDIFTHVVNSLIAVISGSGNIHLSGNPSVNQTITGSGRIIRN